MRPEVIFHDAHNIIAQVRKGDSGLWYWRVVNGTLFEVVDEGYADDRIGAIKRAQAAQSSAAALSGKWITV